MAEWWRVVMRVSNEISTFHNPECRSGSMAEHLPPTRHGASVYRRRFRVRVSGSVTAFSQIHSFLFYTTSTSFCWNRVCMCVCVCVCVWFCYHDKTHREQLLGASHLFFLLVLLPSSPSSSSSLSLLDCRQCCFAQIFVHY